MAGSGTARWTQCCGGCSVCRETPLTEFGSTDRRIDGSIVSVEQDPELGATSAHADVDEVVNCLVRAEM